MKKTEHVRTVCLVTEAAGGGVLTHIGEIAEVLGSEISLSFIYLRRNESPPDEEIQEMVGPTVRLVPVHGAAFARLFKFFVTLLREFRLHHYDIIHCHSSIAGAIGRLAFRCSATTSRILYTPHCFPFLRNDLSAFYRAVLKFLERILAYSGAELVAVSKYEAGIARELGYSRVYLVSNSVVSHKGKSRRMPVGQNLDGLEVVTLGRLALQKDPYLFLTIGRDVVRANHPMHFTWIGGGESETNFQARANRYGMQDKVHLTGWVPHDRALAFLNTCDIYLHTASWEAQPISILEAMSLGKPLIVRNFPGASELVEHGVNGFLFDTSNEAAQYLSDLAKDSHMRKVFGENSLKFFEQRHSLLQFKKCLCELYGV